VTPRSANHTNNTQKKSLMFISVDPF